MKRDRNLKIKLNRETLLKLEKDALSGVHGGTEDVAIKDFALLTSNNTRREPCCGCA